MADTGAPWNLPYPLPTDLVRDGADAIKDLAEATADGLDAAGNPGIGSNVVQTVKTDTFTTTSDTYTTVTGLSVNITPTTATSKVLVIAQIAHGAASGGASAGYGAFKVTRGGTDIYIGDTGSSRVRGVFGGYSNSNQVGNLWSASIVYLDSPTSATQQTYQVEVRRTGGQNKVSINRSDSDSDSILEVRGASSITAIEVAA